MTLALYKGFSWKSWGFCLDQNLQFCLFTYPRKWKWVSSDVISWRTTSSFLLSNQSQNVIMWILYCWRNSCTISSLYGYKFKTFSKFYEHWFGGLCTCWANRRLDFLGLWSIAFTTRSMFTALRDVRGRPGERFLLALAVSRKFRTARRITFRDDVWRLWKCCQNCLCTATIY